MKKKIAIIGGGAGGFFLAANLSLNNTVSIFEAGEYFLSKVRLSGGGRCNLTNNEGDINKLIANYPRGGKFLRKAFRIFPPSSLMDWFESRGVRLKEEDNKKVFPCSNSSEEIAFCLENEVKKKNYFIYKNYALKKFSVSKEKFLMKFSNNEECEADILIFALGGRWNESLASDLTILGHKFSSPCSSLFALNCDDEEFCRLRGVSLKNISLKMSGHTVEGDIIITHKGVSGPAVLKLSSLCARELFEIQYKTTLSIDFLGRNFCSKTLFEKNRLENAKKDIKNTPLFSQNLWEYLLGKSGIPLNTKWANFNKVYEKALIRNLTNFELNVVGKSKDSTEFVTCGGLSLDDINTQTFESKHQKNLFFIGECLDVDGFTGGFNLQFAWSSAFAVAKHINLLS